MWWTIGIIWVLLAFAMIILSGMTDPMGRTDPKLFLYFPVLPIMLLFGAGYYLYTFLTRKR